MGGYPWRIQLLFATTLSLILCIFFLPFSVGWLVLDCLLIVAICGGLFWRFQFNKRKWAKPTTNIDILAEKLAKLPSRQRYRLPILLVTGKANTELFLSNSEGSYSDVLVTSDAIWIAVNEFTAIPTTFDSLVSHWPDMLGRIGLMLTVAPEAEEKSNVFKAQLQSFRQAWSDTCRIAKYQLPVYVAVNVGLNNILLNSKAPLPVSWYQLNGRQIHLLNDQATTLNDWANDLQVSSVEQEQRQHLKAVLTEVQNWTEHFVLSVLSDRKQPMASCVPMASAIYPVFSQAIADNIWQKYLARITTLILPNTLTIDELMPLPDQLVKEMPLFYPLLPKRRAFCHAVMLVALFFIISTYSSYYHNQKLLHRVVNDIHTYNDIAMDNYDPKLHALSILKKDRRQLDEYYRTNVPARYGMGLYLGQTLIEPLNRAINRYIPPPPPPLPPAPDVVQLDSLSLFEVGNAVLKPSSTKVLVDALINIKVRPGWLILISGHTDSTGDPIKNQQLSQARAMAVRDWMMEISDIPEACFAIQGYGAAQPIASNDTKEGRAANRRVEISLVPQVSACQLVTEELNNSIIKER